MTRKTALYAFTWIGGGFNQVRATTKKEAVKEIEKQFKASSLKPNLKSLKRLTEKQEKEYWRSIPPLD